jgi:hypothetical protein
MKRIGPQPRTMRYFRPASQRSIRGWRYWVEHRPQCVHRHPLGHCQCRGDPQTRSGIGRAPDVILASGTSTVGPVLQANV